MTIDQTLSAIRKIVEGKRKRHKKDGDDCSDCGLFNVVGGEICDCEYNQAIDDILKELE